MEHISSIIRRVMCRLKGHNDPFPLMVGGDLYWVCRRCHERTRADA